MKNAYLNDMFTFRIYLYVIQKNLKKQLKCIVNKPKKRRKIRRKICQKIYHIYLLIVLREKTLNFTWRLEIGEKIERVRLKVRVCDNERKMKFWWFCWVLYYVFTERITDEILNIIIFNYFVGDFLDKFTLKFSFRSKLFKKTL
jgi:hypothetical protein